MTRYIDWDEQRKARYDDARERLQAALAECIKIQHEDDDEIDTVADAPYLQGWVAAAEWTNITLEQTDRGGRSTVYPQGQMFSVGIGLGDFIRRDAR